MSCTFELNPQGKEKGTLLTRPAAFLRFLSLPGARQLAAAQTRLACHLSGTAILDALEGNLLVDYLRSVVIQTLSLRRSASDCGNLNPEITIPCCARFAMTKEINEDRKSYFRGRSQFDSGPNPRDSIPCGSPHCGRMVLSSMIFAERARFPRASSLFFRRANPNTLRFQT